jgi:NADH-quinone oxidoreductase subunit G
MATIYIDNVPYLVKDGQNLLYAVLSLGFDLPYFCWHPAMHSVGACRQCAVKQFKDENDQTGRIVMACMTPAGEGTRISIDDPEAREFRQRIAEFLMVNHPHDCPVCDEGGQCHLQDMTLMTGQVYRKYRFKKRTHRNQYLGPFVTHEMNRCIACYRCVRFYRDYAGGRDLNVFNWHHHVYFGREKDGVLESEFAGNLVEVCPTGVFTDKTWAQHYARKWDLETAPSICVHCGVGCNTIPGERYGTLRRVVNRYNGEVNRYFLCDRGRFGYQFVNQTERIRRPMRRTSQTSGLQPAMREDTLRYLGSLLGDRQRTIGIGSPRASLESNFLLRKLVGPERFCLGLSANDARLIRLALEILSNRPVRSPSLRDTELADAVLVLGEDVTNTAPVLALGLRRSTLCKQVNLLKKLQIPCWDDAAVLEAMQQPRRGPMMIATPTATKLDDAATALLRGAPADLARFGFAVAHALDPSAPAVEGLSEETLRAVQETAESLRTADRALVVAGVTLHEEAILHAAANVAQALHAIGRRAELALVVPECNSYGLGLMGGHDLDWALNEVQEGRADTLVIVENDLYRRDEPAKIDRLLHSAKHVVVLDHLPNRTAARAEVVLPAATFAETDGTLVNMEGRGQRFFQVFVPDKEIVDSWRSLRDMMLAAGHAEAARLQTLDDVLAAIAAELPVFTQVPSIAPPATFRMADQKIPRQPHRYSGRTAMFANVTIHEPQTPPDPDSALAYSMEGYQGMPPGSLLPREWAPGWNSPQAVNKFQEEIAGPLIGGDPGRRLIEPRADAAVSYFGELPAAFAARPGQWWIVPLYHCFGSEEQSIFSPGVAEIAPKPYVALGPRDAAALQVQDGEPVEMEIAGKVRSLPVKIAAGLPEGAVGLPVGLPGMSEVPAAEWVTLRKAGAP